MSAPKLSSTALEVGTKAIGGKLHPMGETLLKVAHQVISGCGVALSDKVGDYELCVSVHADEYVLVAALWRIVVSDESLLFEDVGPDFVNLDTPSRDAPDFSV